MQVKRIYKTPTFEDDSYFFKIYSKNISVLVDDYLLTKIDMFKRKNISKNALSPFKNRPSLRHWDNMRNLAGSIYTYAVGKRQGIPYEDVIELVKAEHVSGRKCFVNMANTLQEYVEGEIDTSCLSSIHYMESAVRLTFRSSDIENELEVDLVTIVRYFIEPVYGQNVNVPVYVYASTAQNISGFSHKFKI